ncbi:hypothetical protein G6F58_012989 [Rhizopus delemar]|nr:hypothetical protein G6F58_012989 [Rhizopus delemar]
MTTSHPRWIPAPPRSLRPAHRSRLCRSDRATCGGAGGPCRRRAWQRDRGHPAAHRGPCALPRRPGGQPPRGRAAAGPGQRAHPQPDDPAARRRRRPAADDLAAAAHLAGGSGGDRPRVRRRRHHAGHRRDAARRYHLRQ